MSTQEKQCKYLPIKCSTASKCKLKLKYKVDAPTYKESTNRVICLDVDLTELQLIR